MRRAPLCCSHVHRQYSALRCPRPFARRHVSVIAADAAELQTWLATEQSSTKLNIAKNRNQLLLDLYLRRNEFERAGAALRLLSQKVREGEGGPDLRLRDYWIKYLSGKLAAISSSYHPKAKTRPSSFSDSLEEIQAELAKFEEWFENDVPVNVESSFASALLTAAMPKSQKEALAKRRYSDSSPVYLARLGQHLPLKQLQQIVSLAGLHMEDIPLDSYHIPKDPSAPDKNVEDDKHVAMKTFNSKILKDHSTVSDVILNDRFKFSVPLDKKLTTRPLYEIYDLLKTDDLKQRFLSEYLRFNEQKEVQLEKIKFRLFSTDIISDFKSKYAGEDSDLIVQLSTVFSAKLRSLFKDYQRYYLHDPEAVKEIVKEKNRISSRKLFFKYAPFLDHEQLSLDNLAVMVTFATVSGVLNSYIEGSRHTKSTIASVALQVGSTVEKMIVGLQSEQELQQLRGLNSFVGNFKNIFTYEQLAEIGSCFLDLLLTASHENGVTIFNHVYHQYGDHMVGLLEFTGNSLVMQALKESKLLSLLHNKTEFKPPMLIPAKPWSSIFKGGHYFEQQSVVSVNSPEPAFVLRKADKRGKLDMVYECLDYLGSTGFAINRDVYQVLDYYLKNSTEAILGLPEKVDNITEIYSKNLSNVKHRRERQKMKQEMFNLIGLRNMFERIEAGAGQLSKHGDIFFLPHVIDFRGRAYPSHSHLHHMLEDSVRSLFAFWEGKPLGERGLHWLKVQLANVSGYDKLSTKEKIAMIDANLDNIKDSAANPINGRGWWKHTDKPWQTLAACFELTKALKAPDPKLFISHLAVAQDGSCNGLQHYAALGRDIEGGQEVNLLPSNKKGDVYSKVLGVLKSAVLKDSHDPDSMYNEIATNTQPLLMRKLIKQSVMTSVYGVTRYGMTEQIKNRIEEYLKADFNNLKQGHLKDLRLTEQQRSFFQESSNSTRTASYLANLVGSSLRDLFSGAKRIEDWLVESSRRIVNAVDPEFTFSVTDPQIRLRRAFESYNNVIWTAKTGLPVVQFYRKAQRVVVDTPLQKVTLQLPGRDLAEVDKYKQLNAVAPNFIHSLDATHMALTCLAAKRHGLRFVSVHDSFWTHACDVDQLNRLIREEFVKLYKGGDVVGEVRDEFCARYGQHFQLVYVKRLTAAGVKIVANRKKLKQEAKDKYGTLRRKAVLLCELEREWQTIVRERNRKGLRRNRKDFDRMENGGEEDKKSDDTDEGGNVLGGDRHDDNLLPSAVIAKCDEPVYFKKGTLFWLYSEGQSGGNDGDTSLVIKEKDADFVPVYVPVRFQKVPPKGELNIEKVLESKYFFS